MIDLKKLREDPKAFWESLSGKQKHIGIDNLYKLVEIDKEYRRLLEKVDKLREERNKLSKLLRDLS